MRSALRSDKAAAHPNRSYTWFTFVRDPLERSVSAFFERRGGGPRSPGEELENFLGVVAGLGRRSPKEVWAAQTGSTRNGVGH